MKRINLRLDVTEEERDLIRRAAALGGFRSMAEFCRSTVLDVAHRIDNERGSERGELTRHKADIPS